MFALAFFGAVGLWALASQAEQNAAIDRLSAPRDPHRNHALQSPAFYADLYRSRRSRPYLGPRK